MKYKIPKQLYKHIAHYDRYAISPKGFNSYIIVPPRATQMPGVYPVNPHKDKWLIAKLSTGGYTCTAITYTPTLAGALTAIKVLQETQKP